MRILVCGGRDYSDYKTVCLVLGQYDISEIIHGDCRGADYLAKQYAVENGISHSPFPADWDAHGKAAGPIRNRQMLQQKPDLVIAFPGGRGTDDMCRQAKQAGLKVVRV